MHYFDGGFPSASASLMQGSNVYDLGGFSGNLSRGNELEAVSSDCLYYGQLISAVQRLSTYRNNDLVKTILGLYFDAVTSCIHFDTKEVVSIENEPGLTELVNKSFDEIHYMSLMKESLKDGVYYGSISYKLNQMDDKSFTLDDFKYPYTLGWYRKQNKHVVMSDEGPKFIEDIIRFSFGDLRLELDKDILVQLGLITKEELRNYEKDKRTIYSLPKITCSEPLLLSAELKIKDYALKDLISSFLSLIDLIQQDTFTIDGQRITDSTSLLKLCQKVKGLLVTKDDLNLLMSARLDKTALIRRLFDRVRVIPSIAGALQGMQKLDGTNLADKLNTMNSQKESTREELLTSIGFPIDIYRGGTTKWEAGRQNDRYGTKITHLKTSLITSTIYNARTIIRKLGVKNEDAIKSLNIKTNFAELTPYEVQDKIQKANNSRDFLQSIQDLLRTGTDIASMEGIENVDDLNNLISLALKDAGIGIDITFKKNTESYKAE